MALLDVVLSHIGIVIIKFGQSGTKHGVPEVSKYEKGHLGNDAPKSQQKRMKYI